MRKLIIVASLFFSTTLYSQQKLPVKDGNVMYEAIDTVMGASRDQLYHKAKLWLTNEFVSSKDVIQIDDKDSGQIIGKGNFDYEYSVLGTSATWVCSFTIKIDCKDNKARIQIYNISARCAASMTAEYMNEHPGSSKKHIKSIDNRLTSMLSDFKKSLQKNSSSSSDNF